MIQLLLILICFIRASTPTFDEPPYPIMFKLTEPEYRSLLEGAPRPINKIIGDDFWYTPVKLVSALGQFIPELIHTLKLVRQREAQKAWNEEIRRSQREQQEAAEANQRFASDQNEDLSYREIIDHPRSQFIRRNDDIFTGKPLSEAPYHGRFFADAANYEAMRSSNLAKEKQGIMDTLNVATDPKVQEFIEKSKANCDKYKRMVEETRLDSERMNREIEEITRREQERRRELNENSRCRLEALDEEMKRNREEYARRERDAEEAHRARMSDIDEERQQASMRFERERAENARRLEASLNEIRRMIMIRMDLEQKKRIWKDHIHQLREILERVRNSTNNIRRFVRPPEECYSDIIEKLLQSEIENLLRTVDGAHYEMQDEYEKLRTLRDQNPDNSMIPKLMNSIREIVSNCESLKIVIVKFKTTDMHINSTFDEMIRLIDEISPNRIPSIAQLQESR
ncbi:unnamed protein product [Caenorhabditis bovis]|uniref:Uncharacterized protein n=1 Tax=Caenorhabditis bovis TaxID=2654633 RepID=A0A8S1EAQ3_9PELO|nr:unnamed protein product [Caenorhabditis bovis]